MLAGWILSGITITLLGKRGGGGGGGGGGSTMLSLVCGLCSVCHVLFLLPLGVIESLRGCVL